MVWKGPRVLFLVLLLSVAAGAVHAAGGMLTKQVAAPPTDIVTGVVRLPAPGEVGIRSHSAMIPVRLQRAADGTWTWEGDLAVDDPQAVSMMVLSPVNVSWRTTVQEPGRAPMRLEELSWRGDVRHEQAWLGTDEAAVPGELWRIDRPTTGTWRIRIDADQPTSDGVRPDGFVLVSSKSPYRVFTHLATYRLLPGEAVGLVTRAYDARQDRREMAPEPLPGVIRSATMTVTRPDGTVFSLPMADDGLNADGAAGDGVWGGLFVAEEIGEYTAQVTVRGVTPEGRPFVRTTEHVFPIVARTAELSGTAEAVPGRDALAIRLGAHARQDRPVLASAELW